MRDVLGWLKFAADLADAAAKKSLPEVVPQGDIAVAERVAQARLALVKYDGVELTPRQKARIKHLADTIVGRVQQSIIISLDLESLDYQFSLTIRPIEWKKVDGTGT